MAVDRFPGTGATVRLGVLTAGLAVVLMGIRLATTFITPEPTQGLTSGAEYESLYVIWKVVHGLPAYADQSLIPFAGTFYNWLYYYFYGAVASAVLSVGALSDAFIPMVAKLTTLAGAVGGLTVSWVLSRRLLGPLSPMMAATVAAVWVLVFLGPLMGFWAMATAPDIWALTLDAASVLLFLTLYERFPRRAVAVFALLAYGAWSFKQMFVFSPGAVGLFLLSRRDWRGAGLLALLMIGAWATTLGLGTAAYDRMLFFGGSQVILSPERLLRNLANFAVKSAPLLLGAAAVAAVVPWRTVAVRPLLLVPALGVVVAGLLSGTASAKLGASENYYFTLSFHLALFLLAGLAELERRGAVPRAVRLSLAGGWAVTGVALLGALFGMAGTTSVRPIHDEAMQVSRCVGAQPGPVFVVNPMLALPWLIPSDPAFVPHWNYPLDRAAGVAMEGGGIGGLIASGYFGTLVLATGETTFDGADILSRYRIGRSCGSLCLYHRREPS